MLCQTVVRAISIFASGFSFGLVIFTMTGNIVASIFTLTGVINGLLAIWPYPNHDRSKDQRS